MGTNLQFFSFFLFPFVIKKHPKNFVFMAGNSTRVLENAFGKDVPKGKRVVAHLHKRDNQLEKALAGKIIKLELKLGQLQVLKAHSQAPAQKVDKLAEKFVAILSKIAKKAKNKPSYKWVIPKTVALNVYLLNKMVDRLLVKSTSPRNLLKTRKKRTSIPQRRRKK